MINLSNYKIVLGSGSPRRQELIEHLRLPYSIRVSDVEEIIPDGMNPYDVPAYLSELKSDHLAHTMTDHELIITADTIVILDDQILGKPVDRNDAYRMINWYIDNFNPMDKAGAYGIQDWIGSCKISNISGSYYNIMGLPMHLLYGMLEGLIE